jgi:hypothetical protein
VNTEKWEKLSILLESVASELGKLESGLRTSTDALAKFGQIMDTVNGAHQRTTTKSPEDNSLRDRLIQLLRSSLHMRSVMEAKAALTAAGARVMFGNRNSVCMAHLTRGLLELCAAYAFLSNKLHEAVESLATANGRDKAIRCVERCEAAVSKLYYGSGSCEDTTVKASKPSQHIKEALGLEAYAQYEFLCDLVHPNYGSNTLVSGGTLGEGDISLEEPPINDLAHIAQVARDAANDILDKMDRMSGDMDEIHAWITRLEHEECQAAFARRKAKSAGSGSSAEDPIRFPTARDMKEEKDWALQEISQRGFELESRETLALGLFRYRNATLQLFVQFDKGRSAEQ